MSNQVKLVGHIESQFTLSHTLYSETFYYVTISVKRDSGTVDMLPLLVSDRLIDINKEYGQVYVTGEFRSYNQRGEDKTRLKLYVFVNTIEPVEDMRDMNDVYLEGYLCKQPTYRLTPLGREIADVMLAVNRAYNKCDYIPCIMWGSNAYNVRQLLAGIHIRVTGRVQSREYVKNGETKTAYELSVNLLELG